MIGKKTLLAASGALLCLLSLTGTATADSLKDIQFVSIAADYATATIKKADGSLQDIHVGDVIADGYRVKQITPGRIHLEADTADGPKTLAVRVENGRQWIEPQRNNR